MPCILFTRNAIFITHNNDHKIDEEFSLFLHVERKKIHCHYIFYREKKARKNNTKGFLVSLSLKIITSLRIFFFFLAFSHLTSPCLKGFCAFYLPKISFILKDFFIKNLILVVSNNLTMHSKIILKLYCWKP